MATEPVETVSIRLTADAAELLEEIEKAVADVEAAGDEAGEGFAEAMSEEMKIVGENVREIARELNVSFEEAARALSERGLFSQFSQQEMVAAAEAFGELEPLLVEQGQRAGEALADALTAQTAAVAGQNVRMIADELNTSLQEAAQMLGERGLFARFAEEELTAFAAALEEAGIPIDDLSDKAGLSADQMREFVNILNRTAEAAREAGPALADVLAGISPERFEQIKIEIADFAEAMGVSFEEAALSLSQFADSGQATRQELLAVAQVMQGTGDMSDRARVAIEAINETLDFLGSEGSPKARKEVEAFIETLGDLEGITTAEVETLEQMADQLGEVAGDFVLADEQVAKVVDAFRELGIEIPNAIQRNRIRDYVRQLVSMKDQFGDVKNEADAFTDSIIEQAQETGGLQGILGQLAGSFNIFGLNLGQVVKGVGLAAAAIVVLKTAISAAVQSIREGIQVATSFSEAHRDLALAVRVNSVAGDENTRTFQEWLETAQQVAEIANTSMLVGIESTTRAVRELGAGTQLSDDQIRQLILTGSEFAFIYGVELPAGINQASRFITDGLAFTLSRLGLELGKTAQEQKAFDLGLGSNIDKLDEASKEMVRFALLMEQMKLRTEAVTGDVRTFTERMAELAQRSETAKKDLGTLFLPFVEFFEKAKVTVEEGWTDLVAFLLEGAIGVVSGITAAFLSLAATVTFVMDQLEQGVTPTLKEVGKVLVETFVQAGNELKEVGLEQLSGELDQLEREAQGAAGATGELAGEMGGLAEQVNAFIQEAQKFDEGMEKIQRRLQDALADIETQFRQRRAKAETELQRDLRDIDRKAALDRLDAIRDYQIDEIRLREDHAKDIRQLEERFLLDLEDAVRDRDARQVLQLQRRFNLEKKRREEDFLLRGKRLKEDFQIELQEIDRQRLIRRQQRVLAFQEEMADLAVQEAQRQEMARLRATRAERELLAQIRARLLALAEAAAGELAIEQEKLDALVRALIDTYGPEGPWVGWHAEAVKIAQQAAQGVADAEGKLVNSLARTEQRVLAHLTYIQSAAAREAELAAGMAAFGSSLAGGGGGGGTVLFRQRGGSVIATSPTMLQVGEGRPEQVDITPLSAATGQASAGFRGGDREKMEIELKVDASEQLVVEVADQTMSEIADVYVTINQRGFRGGRGA